MESYTPLPLKVAQSKEYDDLIGMGATFRVYNQLLSYIVRSGNIQHSGTVNLYENYYAKGILAARWSQKNLADKLGLYDKTVSKSISVLEKLGYIEVDRLIVYNGKYNVYKMGKIVNGSEVIFMHEVILRNLDNDNKKVLEERIEAWEAQPMFA